jgi:protein-S-isoprenylcysteine O-methyltransferase Ste14
MWERPLSSVGRFAKVDVSGAAFIASLIVFVGYCYLLLAFLTIIPVQIVRLRNESAVLEAAFGDVYRAYKRMT